MEQIEEDNVNQYERRLGRQQQQVESYAKTIQDQQREIEYKSQQLTAIQDQLSEMHTRLVEIEAKMEQSEQAKEGWREAAEKYKNKLKAFENEDSTEDLKAKLQQKQEQITNISTQNTILQQKYQILQKQLQNNHQAQNIQTIERLLNQSTHKDKSLKLMIEQVTMFQKQIQGFNSKLLHQITKTQSLQKNIIILTQNLKTVTSNLKDSEATVEQLKAILSRKQTEIVNLNDKLSAEYKRKQQGSDHLRQKQAILKDYIELQRKYCLQMEKQQQHQAVSLMLQEQINNMKHSTVSRTHYEMLTKRYLQLKKALEAALRNKDNSRMDVEMPILKSDQSYQGRQIEHYQKLCNTLAELQRDPEKEEQFANLLKENDKKTKLIEELDKTIEIYEAQLKQKQQLLQDFAQKCFKYSSQLSMFQKQQSILKRNLKNLQNDNDIQKMRLNNGQARQMELLTYIGFLQKECSKWKDMSNKVTETEVRKKQHYVVQQPQQQPIQIKIVEVKKNIYQTEKSSQTQTVDYHLDELKKTSAQGKEFIKKLSQALQPLNTIKGELESEKTRYVGIFEAYKTKIKEVKAQRQGLEQWKGKTKEQLEKQIRQQFTELRQLLDNDRLLNCLKKAKYLIQEFEKGEGQNDQADGQMEVQGEGQGDGQAEGQAEGHGDGQEQQEQAEQEPEPQQQQELEL